MNTIATHRAGSRRTRTKRAARWCVLGALAMAVPLAPGAAVEAAPDRVVQEGESIQAAIDAAPPGTVIKIRGHHTENVWIHKDGIVLKGLAGASMTLPETPTYTPCGFPVVVCAIPGSAVDAFPEFPPLYTHLRDIGVQDLTLNSAEGDGVALLFVRGADISNNVVPELGCNAVWVFVSSGIGVRGNHAVGSSFCDGIQVLASERVRVLGNTSTGSAFAGIAIADSSTVRVQGNTTTGNCIGIVAFDDFGPIPARDITITRNTANANNTVCFPLGPDTPIGATGILGAGVDGLTIKNNTANDNVTDQTSVTAAGIAVSDSPGGVLTEDLLLSRNTARGNASAAGPVDIAVVTLGSIRAIKKNNCDVSVPDPAWCEG